MCSILVLKAENLHCWVDSRGLLEIEREGRIVGGMPAEHVCELLIDAFRDCCVVCGAGGAVVSSGPWTRMPVRADIMMILK